MYKKGDLKITEAPCDGYLQEGYCGIFESHMHHVTDARESDTTGMSHPCVYLPHSCDEWLIGRKENIEWMIEDLLEILKRFE